MLFARKMRQVLRSAHPSKRGDRGSRARRKRPKRIAGVALSYLQHRRAAGHRARALSARARRRRLTLAAIAVFLAVAASGAAAGVAVMSPGSGPVSASGSQESSVDGAEGSESGLRDLPAQAAGLVYGDPAQAEQYAHPGGLVVAGRDNFQGSQFKDVSARGGTVLIYLDPVIDNPHGRYHALLNEESECGPATARWPGSYRANTWGYLNDFRVGSVVQTKLECVLEKMVEENPHMGGWFADDIGSRSWFAGVDWDKFPDQAAYRDGAIALTKTFRRVADRHHLIFLVNGTWAGGPLASAGGGYPNSGKSGNALADGGVVEHHDGEIRYFGPYACSTQWAEKSPVTRGEAFNYAITSTYWGSIEYRNSSCYAFVNQQTDYEISRAGESSHPTGLPNRVR